MRDASSRDTTGLGLDSRSQSRLERRSSHQIHPNAQGVLQEQLESHEAVECCRSDEVHQQVQVTRICRFAPRNRAEHGELLDPEARAHGRQKLGKP